MEYKFENISIIDFIKTICIFKGSNLRKVLQKLVENKHYSNAYANFYNKLKNNTIRFSEVVDIAETLGYEIIFRNKTNAK